MSIFCQQVGILQLFRGCEQTAASYGKCLFIDFLPVCQCQSERFYRMWQVMTSKNKIIEDTFKFSKR